MKQEENMVALLARGMLMLSLVDSPICPGSPCWCHLSCSFMPSLMVSPHWCRLWSPHVAM